MKKVIIGFVPLVVAILLGLSGVALIAQARRASNDKAVRWPTAEARRMVLYLAIALTAYVLLMWILGFVPSTFLFLLVAVGAWKQEGRKKVNGLIGEYVDRYQRLSA